MSEKQSISMSGLKNSSLYGKIKVGVITCVITALTMISVDYFVEKYQDPEESVEVSPKITLEDVVIAYAPEQREIVFLNRNDGTVNMILSDSVSIAVFALKSFEFTKDYRSNFNR